MRRLYSIACSVVLATLLGACATQAPEPAVDADWALHRQALESLSDWEFSGKIAVRTPRGGESARLTWIQRDSDLQLDISGPAGFKRVTLMREAGRYKWRNRDAWEALDSGDAALERELGWPLPLDYLPWWLRGLPAPLTPATEMEFANGRLQKLSQGGWQIEYPAYQDIDRQSLPRTILFRRDDVEGKILLKRWNLGP